MRYLLLLAGCLVSQLGFGAVITHVSSDWVTYQIDLVTDSNYTVFGGGSAGDIFHIQFEFNNAYLPYFSGDINSEWQSTDFASYINGTQPDTTTAAPDDYLQFDDLPLIAGDHLHFIINGSTYDTGSPFLLTINNGAITAFHSSVYGGVNAIIGGGAGTGTFIMTDQNYSGNVAGSICDISELSGPGSASACVSVPEPGSVLLLLSGLAGLFWSRRKFRA